MAEDTSGTATLEPEADVLESEIRQVRPQGPPPFFPEPPGGSGGDDRFGDDDDHAGRPLSNAYIGLLMFLGAETMFFAGLIGSFLVFRVAHEVWPPATLPRLPVGVTGVNTLILLASALTMGRARAAIRGGAQRELIRMLLVTTVLGVVFLLVQGYEWIRLLQYGLTLASGVYGATFYVLVGCHGVHVLGAVIWLLSVLRRAGQRSYTAKAHTGVALCAMYWYYVVALWPILYGLVYLY